MSDRDHGEWGICLKIRNLFGEETVLSKTCSYCNTEKPLFDFPKHKGCYDGYDTRCKACIKERSKLTNQIRKTAPPKPEVCDCCGRPPVNQAGRRKVSLAMDHNPETNEFRGWLCNACNVAFGLLGDREEGIKKLLNYNKRYEKRKRK